MNVKIYVEGRGDRRELQANCRKGFSAFFDKAGLAGRMPRVIPGGSRKKTFDKFRHALNQAAYNEFIVLLVDSEEPVLKNSGPWLHLKNRDEWDKPAEARDDNAHLMVQCMEAWFLADKVSLAAFFGNGFNSNALPKRSDIENIPKDDITNGLKKATTRCDPKGIYNKGNHSFAILAQLNPDKVIGVSPHANRLVETLLDKASAR